MIPADTKPPRKLKPKQRLALPLLVADTLTDQQIADEVGITKSQLEKWKNPDLWPEFDAAYHAELTDWCARMRSKSFTVKERRLDVLIGMAKQCIEILRERDDPAIMKELRATLDQVAGEMGQKTEKVEMEVRTLVREYVGVSPDAV